MKAHRSGLDHSAGCLFDEPQTEPQSPAGPRPRTDADWYASEMACITSASVVRNRAEAARMKGEYAVSKHLERVRRTLEEMAKMHKSRTAPPEFVGVSNRAAIEAMLESNTESARLLRSIYDGCTQTT